MLTVGDLLEMLRNLDPSLPVVMTMQLEYEVPVDDDMVYVSDFGDGPTLYIDDTRGIN